MEIQQFKTNTKCEGCVAKIRPFLNKILPEDSWKIDLHTPDKILTVTADCPTEEIIKAVEAAGFQAEKIRN